jgi:hypothetical protein
LNDIWRRLEGLRAAENQVRQIPMVIHNSEEARQIADFPTRCAVCLEDFVDGDQLRVLGCRHRFHTTCVDRWLIHHRRLVSYFMLYNYSHLFLLVSNL